MRALRLIRILVIAFLVLVVAIPATMYLMLSSAWVQEHLRKEAETELSAYLNTKVNIGGLHIAPFNRIELDNVKVADDNGVTALDVGNVSARFELFYMLRTGKILIDYAKLNNATVKLYRETPDSPLNIDGIIATIKSKKKESKPSRFELRIDNIEVTNTAFSYDVRSVAATPGRFNASHINVSGLSTNVHIPYISNDRYTVHVNHLALKEQCGLDVRNITAKATYTPKSINVNGLAVELPKTCLLFSDIHSDFENIKELAALGRTRDAEIKILEGSFITPSDLKAFAPVLAPFDATIDLNVDVCGTLSNLDVRGINIGIPDWQTYLDIVGKFANITDVKNLKFRDLDLSLETLAPQLAAALDKFGVKLPGPAYGLIDYAGDVSLNLRADGSLESGEITADISTALGDVDTNLAYEYADKTDFSLTGDAQLASINLNNILSRIDLGILNGSVSIDWTQNGSARSGVVEAVIDQAEYNGYAYNDIYASLIVENNDASFNFNINDENALANIDASYSKNPHTDQYTVSMRADIDHINFAPLHLHSSLDKYALSTVIDASFKGADLNKFAAHLNVDALNLRMGSEKTIVMDNLEIDANNLDGDGLISINSDYINGQIRGEYCLPTLIPQIKEMAAHIFPAYFEGHEHDRIDNKSENINNFVFDFSINEDQKLERMVKLPVEIISPVTISGAVHYGSHMAYIDVDAPYLLQGNKIIEGTKAFVSVNCNEGTALAYATTSFPTKKGQMALTLDAKGANNCLDTKINWEIQRAIPINGIIPFTAEFTRNAENKFCANVTFQNGQIIFGDDTWNIYPSKISYADKVIKVENFNLSTPTQSIAIDGVVSASNDDVVKVDLKDIQLIDIFETLEIGNALIGGSATGQFEGRSLLSSEPKIFCPGLVVKNIGYNHCTLGDAVVKANWDNEKSSFYLDADIVEPGGLHSRIYGDIFPATESLDIKFDANHVKVGFMQPFMAAFASDVSGYASGHARLFGTFKYIDMTGDVYADDLKLKINFTNTYYHATDSIKLTPGKITLKDVTIRDDYGNTALLNGVVTHKFFKQPSFDFAVTQARNFLSYDVGPDQSPDWYGKIFGNGTAYIKGAPGVVNINVNMSTAPKSTFTFVLSDTEEAGEYSFITFRDKKALMAAAEETVEIVDDGVPDKVKELRAKNAQKAADNPSAYNMDIQIDITPDAQIIIVMDPIGGDEIKSSGTGNLRMTYEWLNNDLRMYGTYTLDKGSYNFTLQDIILKDFTIRKGSSIKFNGDPYAAVLDINAIYQVYANLSDLDVSFLQDKDLNRTSVPVYAVMKVTGDMRQPDVNFDLEFPTLTSDVYRKVRSIVSTEEMMNRQIIYLLALNRFYTPDYMASTTKGNELFSVASSTISSQLSSMLGKLSENWSIAPNLRSERGDFSDVEVDLMLSSTLLNNRLLFNGNLGYRDKSLNNNQFVGDFDIEYLLTREGGWRLKAYNRYNDQNYYLRTAQTTQGVGLVFKRDFDNIFGWLKRKKKTPGNDTSTDNDANSDAKKPDDNSAVETDAKEIIPTENK